MNRISTHVLDTARGKPATGFARASGAAGSVRQLGGVDLGAHRSGWPLWSTAFGREHPSRRNLPFDVRYGRLFCWQQKIDGLYPVVEITFRSARRRIAFPHSTAVESERIHNLPGKLISVNSSIREWIQLGVRWFHVFAGIMWVGQTYYFTWLDGQFGKLEAAQKMPAIGAAPALVDGAQRRLLYRRKTEVPGGRPRAGPLVSLGSGDDLAERNGADVPSLLLRRRVDRYRCGGHFTGEGDRNRSGRAGAADGLFTIWRCGRRWASRRQDLRYFRWS